MNVSQPFLTVHETRPESAFVFSFLPFPPGINTVIPGNRKQTEGSFLDDAAGRYLFSLFLINTAGDGWSCFVFSFVCWIQQDGGYIKIQILIVPRYSLHPAELY